VGGWPGTRSHGAAYWKKEDAFTLSMFIRLEIFITVEHQCVVVYSSSSSSSSSSSVCPEAVLPASALYSPTFSHFLIVNKTPQYLFSGSFSRSVGPYCYTYVLLEVLPDSFWHVADLDGKTSIVSYYKRPQ
jgi:hypothetical protein